MALEVFDVPEDLIPSRRSSGLLNDFLPLLKASATDGTPDGWGAWKGTPCTDAETYSAYASAIRNAANDKLNVGAEVKALMDPQTDLLMAIAFRVKPKTTRTVRSAEERQAEKDKAAALAAEREATGKKTPGRKPKHV